MASENSNQNAPQGSGARTDLSAHFTRSVSYVQHYTSQFEHQVARPALSVAADLFGERPVLATFLTTLFALSFFPIVTFLVVSALTVVTLVSSALVLSLSAAFAAVLAFFGILVSTVIGSAVIAAIITNIAICSYLFLRLLFLLQRDGFTEGFTLWAGEIWTYLVSVIGTVQRILSRSPKEVEEHDHDTRSETTNESAVLVHDRDDLPTESKIEESSSEEVVKVKGY